MFPLEARGKPGRDYPRIGPSFCTKWFEPSILPGPILPSWTTSQPYNIDAGGSIFLQSGGDNTNVSNQEGGARTYMGSKNRPQLAKERGESKRANHLSTTRTDVRRRKCRVRGGTPPTRGTSGNNRGDSRLDTCGGHWDNSKLKAAGVDWDYNSRLDTTGGGRHQGAVVLHHAGSILRCRSVYARSRTPPRSSSSSSKSVTDIIDTTAAAATAAATAAAAAVAPEKPRLRAYSAPQFLHSTSFPPVSRTHSTCCGKATARGAADSSRSRRRCQTSAIGAGDGHTSRRCQTSTMRAGGGGHTSRRCQTSTMRADDAHRRKGYHTAAIGADDGRTQRKYQTPTASNGRSCGCRARTSHGDTRRQESNNNTSSSGAVGDSAAVAAVAGAAAGAGAAGAGGGAAPCRHRRAGYLHRYMGFVQEKVSSPPLETFRALGGLRDFPRKGSSAAVVGKTLNGHLHDAAAAAAAAASVDPVNEEEPATFEAGDGGRLCSLDTRSKRSCEGRRSAAAVGGGPSDTAGARVPRKKQACPLELFADGSSLAPISPPNAAQIIPAWCSRSKRRPKGAKRQKSWEADAGKRKALGYHPKYAQKNKPPGITSLNACKAKTRSFNRRAGSLHLVGVLLPYDLERPVSPERADAFHYTCN